MHQLAVDPGTAPHAQGTFSEYLAGNGYIANAEAPTADGARCPACAAQGVRATTNCFSTAK